MKINEIRVGFIGMGHMAGAICRALIRTHLIPRSQILFIERDRDRSKQHQEELGITATSQEHLAANSNFILIGVRPGQAEGVLLDFAEYDFAGKSVLSIMAGIQMAYVRKHLGPKVHLLRAMPNMCAERGEAMTLLSYAAGVPSEIQGFARQLFQSMGHIAEIPEEQMDIGTALVGSGPGFVFPLIDAFAREAEREGMSYATALQAAAQVFIGAAKLIQAGERPDDLILRIATPGGTTEAGLAVLRDEEVGRRMRKVLAAAAKKAADLSNK